MKPLDSDLEYAAGESREADPRARFNWLYIIPGLGALWLLFLACAAIFQWPVSGVVNPVMSFMLLFFFIIVGLLFWALAPKANRE
ncbi:MAG TPA: hypothetical protein VKY19_11355 [Ktedonosporobacter sp.]|jgi:fatty acid desaturase|nr:hypothetical protein [Ktedonosporobacter sp.]